MEDKQEGEAMSYDEKRARVIGDEIPTTDELAALAAALVGQGAPPAKAAALAFDLWEEAAIEIASRKKRRKGAVMADGVPVNDYFKALEAEKEAAREKEQLAGDPARGEVIDLDILLKRIMPPQKKGKGFEGWPPRGRVGVNEEDRLDRLVRFLRTTEGRDWRDKVPGVHFRPVEYGDEFWDLLADRHKIPARLSAEDQVKKWEEGGVKWDPLLRFEFWRWWNSGGDRREEG
jgi:hypothetical protein